MVEKWEQVSRTELIWVFVTDVGIRLKIPFRYRDVTRPPRPGPFPSNVRKTPMLPKTLFQATLRARSRKDPDLEVHVSSPSS